MVVRLEENFVYILKRPKNVHRCFVLADVSVILHFLFSLGEFNFIGDECGAKIR